jgi:ParB/RepB/Spo0J family partition protein
MLDESGTNPRRTFEPTKLVELAHSLTIHGLIQPITVRPKGDRFEVVAGARRFRAAQIAELADMPTRILELSDEQTLEIQIVENAQRQDVHPYEEATGYQRLLDLPGHDVAGLACKCGKSQSHIYARLSLLQLIPDVAEAFQNERIAASHANLIARAHAGAAGRNVQELFPQGLAGQGKPSFTREASCRVDRRQFVSRAGRGSLPYRLPRVERRGRSLPHLPTPYRLQHTTFCGCGGRPLPRRRLLQEQGCGLYRAGGRRQPRTRADQHRMEARQRPFGRPTTPQ